MLFSQLKDRTMDNEMKWWLFALIASVFLAFEGNAAATVEPESKMKNIADSSFFTEVKGEWRGAIVLPQVNLPIVFRWSDGGSLVMDSPAQGVSGLPVNIETSEDSDVALFVPAAQGRFQGNFGSDQKRLTGTWSQGGQTFEMSLDHIAAAEDTSAIEPETRLVVFPSREPSIQISGSLTLASNSTTSPVVILIGGSGVQDRDYVIAGKPFFKHFANDLASAGVSSLRYDERGVGGSEGSLNDHKSFNKLAADAAGAFDFLVSSGLADSNKIGFIGHSEGALIALKAGLQIRDKPLFLVTLAGPTIPMRQLIMNQVKRFAPEENLSDDEIDTVLERQRYLFQLMDSSSSDDQIAKRIQEYLSETETSETEIHRIVNFAVLNRGADTFSYDPTTDLQKISFPSLVLYGGKDVQVSASLNLRNLKSLLQFDDNGHDKYPLTYKVFEECNHLFQTSKTGAINEYAQIDDGIAPEVTEFISKWVKAI